MNITPTFRAGFDIDDSHKRADLVKFCDAVHEAARPFDNLHISETSAGPAWSAYYVIHCDDRDTLAQFLALLPPLARTARVALNDWEEPAP